MAFDGDVAGVKQASEGVWGERLAIGGCKVIRVEYGGRRWGTSAIVDDIAIALPRFCA